MRDESLVSGPEYSAFGDYKTEFNLEQRELLDYFFSNTDKPVYTVRLNRMPTIVAAAIITRQSMSPLGLRAGFLEEFVDKFWEARALVINGCKQPDDYLAIDRAEGLINRNFAPRHHEQLAKVYTMVMGIEHLSQLGVKGVEEARVGVIPLESSTRYQDLSRPDSRGQYPYIRDPNILRSPHANLYVQTIDGLFRGYGEVLVRVNELVDKKYPEKSDHWRKNHSLDLSRPLLPAALITKVGISANALAIERLSIKLRASQLAEHRELGEMFEKELIAESAALGARLNSEWGPAHIDYLAQTQEGLSLITKEFVKDGEPQKAGVRLADYDADGENKVIGEILWQLGDRREEDERAVAVAQMSGAEKEKIVDAYCGARIDKFSKPWRAFEAISYKFELVIPFEIYRDLMRQQINTQYRHLLSFDDGLSIEPELAELDEKLVKFIEQETSIARGAYEIIRRDFPQEAQYLVTFGANMRFRLIANLRECIYIDEHRSGSGAHPGYKRAAQQMKMGIERVHPILARAFKFVDMSGEEDWINLD